MFDLMDDDPYPESAELKPEERPEQSRDEIGVLVGARRMRVEDIQVGKTYYVGGQSRTVIAADSTAVEFVTHGRSPREWATKETFAHWAESDVEEGE